MPVLMQAIQVAPSLGAFLDWIVDDPPRVFADESVTPFGNEQYMPIAYISGR